MKRITRASYRRAALEYNALVCSHCGFVPLDRCQLEVDHIDGDRENNTLDNLQVLCANCHALKHHRPDLFTCEDLFQRVIGPGERKALFELLTSFRAEAFVGNDRPRTYTKNPEAWAPVYSEARKSILSLLHQEGKALPPRKIAVALGMNNSTVYSLLRRMSRDQSLTREGGKYRPSCPLDPAIREELQP